MVESQCFKYYSFSSRLLFLRNPRESNVADHYSLGKLTQPDVNLHPFLIYTFVFSRKTFDFNLIPEAGYEEGMDPIKCLPFRRVVVFRFHPTDQELLLGYLQPFLEGKPLIMNKIHQQNVYGFNLVQLPGSYD